MKISQRFNNNKTDVFLKLMMLTLLTLIYACLYVVTVCLRLPSRNENLKKEKKQFVSFHFLLENFNYLVNKIDIRISLLY